MPNSRPIVISPSTPRFIRQLFSACWYDDSTGRPFPPKFRPWRCLSRRAALADALMHGRACTQELSRRCGQALSSSTIRGISNPSKGTAAYAAKLPPRVTHESLDISLETFHPGDHIDDLSNVKVKVESASLVLQTPEGQPHDPPAAHETNPEVVR
jgi:hypothetical protein